MLYIAVDSMETCAVKKVTAECGGDIRGVVVDLKHLGFL